MRVVIGIAACLAVVGCTKAPLDCGAVKQRLDGCFDKYRSAGSRAVLLNCYPYSATERVSGTWAHSFEFNQFYEDQKLSTERAFTIKDDPVELVVDPPLEPKQGGVPLSQLAEVVFEGRRPLCDFGEGRWIIVDRMISQSVTFSKPYGPPP